MNTTTEWLTSPKVQAWCDKEKKYREMTATEYSTQLNDLVENASIYLPDAESLRVLSGAFNLIYARLGISIKSRFIIPGINDESEGV